MCEPRPSPRRSRDRERGHRRSPRPAAPPGHRGHPRRRSRREGWVHQGRPSRRARSPRPRRRGLHRRAVSGPTVRCPSAVPKTTAATAKVDGEGRHTRLRFASDWTRTRYFFGGPGRSNRVNRIGARVAFPTASASEAMIRSRSAHCTSVQRPGRRTSSAVVGASGRRSCLSASTSTCSGVISGPAQRACAFTTTSRS